MKRILTTLIVMVIMVAFSTVSFAKDSFKVSTSLYTGWAPWKAMSDNGMLKKHADKNGIKIEVTVFNDYLVSMQMFSSGEYDALTVANTDLLLSIAAANIPSKVVIMGDTSLGNDGIVAKNAKTMADLKKREVMLMVGSVSHYLLYRALETNGMSFKDLKKGGLINTSDSNIVASYMTTKNAVACTWNPPLMQLRTEGELLFSSDKIPGEILDLVVTQANSDERFIKAIVGAWYESMEIMLQPGKNRDEFVSAMAKDSDTTVAEFEAQVRTTGFYYTPTDALSFYQNAKLPDIMEKIDSFLFSNAIYDSISISKKGQFGMKFPGGVIRGNTKNVLVDFDDKYTKALISQ